MMSEIEFVDEPPRSTFDRDRRRKVLEFAAELRKNPGRWAIYPWPSSNEGARALAFRISHGCSVAFADGFNATARGTVTYVCYEGTES
jgi:hypothetical protein